MRARLRSSASTPAACVAAAPARAVVAACLLGALGALSACGGDASGGVAVTTVTITPTVTVTGPAQPATRSPSLGTPPKSQVKGRRYDFGTVTKLVKSGGYDVVVLDRWTVPTVRDSRLAREGLPIRSYQGMPFTNQNTKAVWRIPARPAAVVLLHHCTATDDPWQTRSGTVADLGSLPDEDKLVLLTLDNAGWMVRAENLPRCP
jgi:GAF domain-containing protein